MRDPFRVPISTVVAAVAGAAAQALADAAADAATVDPALPPPQFVCPLCGARTWSVASRRAGWCAVCEDFTGTPDPHARDPDAAVQPPILPPGAPF